MANILFLPTWTDIEGASYPPRLGLIYLASVVRQHFKDCRVKLLDLNLHCQTVHERFDDIKSFNPDIIGITCMSYEAETVHKSAAYLKKVLPGVKIIIGGPYPSASPLRSIQDHNIDFAILGEGEDTFPELLERIFANRTDFRDVKGIAFRYEGEPLKTPQREFRKDLDSIPFPAWDILDMEQYFKVKRFQYIHVEKRYMPIYTSRGCPYQCTYCHDIFGKTFRARSPENIFAEIRYLHDHYGIKEFQIFDDIFNIQTKRAIGICDLIIQSGLKIYLSFPNGLRGDIMTEELLYKLKRAGTYKIAYAIETASSRLQKLIKKNVRLDRLKRVIEQTDEAGILCHGFFMMGFPTETKEEVMKTAEYALTSKLHFGGFYFLDPFEGTEIAEWALQMHPDLLERQNDHGYFLAKRQLSEVPTEELEAIHRNLYRKFYFNPRRLFRMLRLLPKKTQALSLILLWLQMSFEAFKLRIIRQVDLPDATPSSAEASKLLF